SSPAALLSVFFLLCCFAPRDLPSFPTRRSSDLLYHKGEPVKRIQAAVGVKADSYYGPDTVKAVKKWQKANGLAADGIFGKNSWRSEEHTSELQSRFDLVCRLLLVKKKTARITIV